MTYGMKDSAVLGTAKRLTRRKSSKGSSMEGWSDALRLVVKNQETATKLIVGLTVSFGIFATVLVIYLLPW